jgi:hypothetical protein
LPIIAAVGATLVGDAITAAINVPANALSNAAAAEKSGYTVANVDARRFYSVQTAPATAPGGPLGYEITAPRCYVVAYTKPADKPQNWCTAKSDFLDQMTATCSKGKGVLDGLTIRERTFGDDGKLVGNDMEYSLDNLAVPERFYAEIALEPAGFATVAKPRVVAMYYPKSLLQASSTKPRALTLTLNFTSPTGGTSDAFKAATVSVFFPAITPGPKLDEATLRRELTSWTMIPPENAVAPKQEDLKAVYQKVRYLPVTISAQLSEIGDPSAFLAAFAQAFGGSAGELTKDVLGGISISGAPSSYAQQAATNQAKYYSDLGGAQQSRSQLLALCSKGRLLPSDKANAQGLFNATVAKQQTANLDAAIIGQSTPFSNAGQVEGVTDSCWQ